MSCPRIVIDTNVVVSALISQEGASFRLLSLVGSESFEICVSVPLILEYEDAAKRPAVRGLLTDEDIDDILDYVCRVAHRQQIFFLWRPFLKDPKDDHVLEVAVESGCEFIVTHNIRHFNDIESFGLRAVTPQDFLRILGEIP